jgi:hypothetical protein
MSFDLLQISDKGILEIHPSALTIKVIADLWNRDRTNSKEQALKELAFIYWIYHWNSSYYKGYSDIQERYNAVITEVFQDISWKPDLEVNEAIKVYKKLQEEAYPELKHLQTARKTLESLKDFLDNLDPDERTKSGGLLLKPSDIYSAVGKMGEALIAVQKMEEKIKKELQLETQKIKGGGRAGAFEDEKDLDYLKNK